MSMFYAGQADYITQLNNLAALVGGGASWTANRVIYANGSGALSTSSNLTFDGSVLGIANQQYTPWAGSAPAGVGASMFYGTLTGTGQVGIYSILIQTSGGTSTGYAVQARVDTAAAAFTLTEAAAFYASNPSIGGGSAITNYNGFYCANTATGGTFQSAFHGAMASGTGKFNLYMSGTAQNYIAGVTGLGNVGPVSDRQLYVANNNLSGTGQYGIVTTITSTSGGTAENFAYYGANATAAASFTLANAAAFCADNATKGAGSTITNLVGFLSRDLTVGGFNAGFRGMVTSGASKWNLYMDGSASNYLAGPLFIGSTQNDLLLGIQIQATGTGGYFGYSASTYSTNAAESCVLDFKRSKSASIGTMTAVASGDALGGIYFRGADGTTLANLSSFIRANVDGTVSTGIVPGRLEFHTTSAAGADQLVLTLDKAKLATFAGAVTVTGGSLDATSAVSGGNVQLTASNTSNTANSNAYCKAIVAGGSAGDAAFYCQVTGGQDYTVGVDNSDSDAYVGSVGSALGTNNFMRVSSARAVSIFGTATNDDAAAGFYGEYITSQVVSGSSVSLTTNTVANITSISLGAGDWDVTGVIDFTFGATTSYTRLQGGISTTSATMGSVDNYFQFEIVAQVPTATVDPAFVVPTVRLSLSGTTTVYLVVQGTFTVSTLKAYGRIRARRVR